MSIVIGIDHAKDRDVETRCTGYVDAQGVFHVLEIAEFYQGGHVIDAAHVEVVDQRASRMAALDDLLSESEGWDITSEGMLD